MKESKINTSINVPFIIERNYNASTGYKNDFLISKNIKYIDNTYDISTDAPPGRGGIQKEKFVLTDNNQGYILIWFHRPWEKNNLDDVELITIIPKLNKFYILLDDNDKVIGYNFNEEINLNNNINNDYNYNKLELNIDNIKILKSISFYKLNDKYYYIPENNYNMSDKLYCVYNTIGEILGCPSGGLSGKGDGKLPKFYKESKYLGKININMKK